MLTLRIADLTIRVDNRYPYLARLCRGYRIGDSDLADFTVSVTDEEIEAEHTDPDDPYMPDYLESLAVYRKIADRLLYYSGFLMHGVLMSAGGRGILLCARSGVGKTTHARHWIDYLGADECHIINGDKPLIRRIDGTFYAYGTPWNGKERISENRRIPLTDVAFIVRAPDNETEPLKNSEALPHLVPQVHFPKNPIDRIGVLDLVGDMIWCTRFWTIRCINDRSAARVAHHTMFECPLPPLPLPQYNR